MRFIEEKLLKVVLGRYNAERMEKAAQESVIENSMWANMIDGALKALEFVAIASLDWKLTAIVKLLQSWLSDKREEKTKREQQTLYGVGYKAPTTTEPYDPYKYTYY